MEEIRFDGIREVFLSVEEVSNMLNVSKSTIRNWCSFRGLPHIKIARKILIRKVDLMEWLERYKRGDIND
jgi:excisionase family DNA binding protein